MTLAVACGRGAGDSGEEKEIARAAAELRAAEPIAAADRVTALARTGCDGLARALTAISQSQISGQLLSGLVADAVDASAEACPRARAAEAAHGSGAARALARSRLHGDDAGAALAELAGAGGEPSVHARRAELLEALGRPAEALAELDAAGDAVPPTPPDQTAPRLRLAVAAAAAAGRAADTARLVASASLPDRPDLARRAARGLPPAAIGELASLPEVDVELLAAAADRVEEDGGAAAALTLRERAAASAPDRAELADAHARALLAAGRAADAVAAWDRAAAAAPAQPAYQASAIRALAASGEAAVARARAARIAAAARASRDADRLAQASAAAAAAGDTRGAVALAREARAMRPGDGSLAFLLGERLAEAGDVGRAAEVWTDLLVCGAHGRAWHRHELAGRLGKLGARGDAAVRAITATLRTERPCRTVEPDDLAPYLDGIVKQLAGPIPP